MEEPKKKTEPKFVVDVAKVTTKDTTRVLQWTREIMKKYESKLNYEYKEGEIIASGEIEPENLDIRSVYPFKDLNWIIYRRGTKFNILLRSGHNKLLFVNSFAKI